MNQGFFDALEQYWTVEEKPRLHRRNTYFEDVEVSNEDAVCFSIFFIVLAIAIISFCMIRGLLVWGLLV